MKTSSETEIGIIGSGKMGRDLFDFLCGFPFQITMVCESTGEADKQKKGFLKKQRRALKYGLVDESNFSFRETNTVFSTELISLKSCKLVIEAIPENLEIKKVLFRNLEGILSESCILASNTSSIPLDELFNRTAFEQTGLGLHFFFPIALKDWVEINAGSRTSIETIDKAKQFLKRIDKRFLLLEGDSHFILNRVFLKMQAGCAQLVKSGKISCIELDTLVKSDLFPAGVFSFFDHVGLDVMLQSIENYLPYESDKTYFRPLISLLTSKIEEGKLGLKTKSGFYNYPLPKSPGSVKVKVNSTAYLQPITSWYLDGVFDFMKKDICSSSELAECVQNYMMIEKSPFELAKEIGYTPK